MVPTSFSEITISHCPVANARWWADLSILLHFLNCFGQKSNLGPYSSILVRSSSGMDLLSVTALVTTGIIREAMRSLFNQYLDNIVGHYCLGLYFLRLWANLEFLLYKPLPIACLCQFLPPHKFWFLILQTS